MDEVVRLLRELRLDASATEVRRNEFIQLCDVAKVPRVTIYMPAACEGWYEMYRAYLFSKRTDYCDTIWYFSPRTGILTVYDSAGKNGKPFESWDPEADLFFDQSLYDGGTNMDPVERERSGRRQ